MPGCMPKKIRKRKIGDKENKRGISQEVGCFDELT